jgi:hypothetical protein
MRRCISKPVAADFLAEAYGADLSLLHEVRARRQLNLPHSDN